MLASIPFDFKRAHDLAAKNMTYWLVSHPDSRGNYGPLIETSLIKGDKYWSEPGGENFIFNPKLRLAGFRNDVENFIRQRFETQHPGTDYLYYFGFYYYPQSISQPIYWVAFKNEINELIAHLQQLIPEKPNFRGPPPVMLSPQYQ